MTKRTMVLVMLLAIVFLVEGYAPAEGSWWDRKGIRGSGDVIEVDREVEDIHGVELATMGTLYIEVGDEEALTIRGEDNLIEYIETEVRRGILTIDTESGVNLNPRKALKYYLTVKELDEIAISSSGDIKAPDLDADEFTISVSSSGDLDMGTLNCTNLEVDISSSGEVYIDELIAKTIEADLSSSGDLEFGDGEVEEQEITISSSGDYNGKYLASNEAQVRISSSGDATVRVRDYLDARTNSSGDIYYYGDPETVDSWEGSSGDVKRVGK